MISFTRPLAPPLYLMTLISALPNAGSAFTAADDIPYPSVDIGDNCSVARLVIDSSNAAILSVAGGYKPGGSFFYSLGIASGDASISVSSLAACLGVTEADTSNLDQNGADGTYATDTYMGFSFDLAVSTGYLAARSHEFAIRAAGSDTTAPELTAPVDQTLSTEAGQATASFDVTSLGTGSDDTDETVTITYAIGGTPLTGAYDFPVGDTTVTMNATDTAGNAATAVSFTVTVTDDEHPTLSAPDDVVHATDSGVATYTLDVTSLGSASDNVDTPQAITYTIGGTPVTGPYDFPVGDTTVTMNATDTAGNAATPVSFTVTVTDGETPVLTAPDDVILSAEAGAETSSYDVTGLGSVSDNSDADLEITYAVGGTTLTGAYDFPIGDTTVTMNATDSAGNAATEVSFTVTVAAVSSDTEAPVLTAPEDQSVYAEAEGDTTAALDVTGLGSVSDDTDTDLEITYAVGDTTLTGAYDFPIGDTTVTMNATDSAGNAATEVSFTVTALEADVAAPDVPVVATVAVLADLRLTVSGTAEFGATVIITFPDQSSVEVIAGGDSAKSDVARTLDRAATTSVGSYSVTSADPQPSGDVTVLARDDAGNSSSAAVAVADTEAPDVTLSGGPADGASTQETFTVTVEFSESVTGFEIDDISLSSATVQSLSGSGSTYTAVVRGTGSGELRIQIPAGAAEDSAGNDSGASNTLVFSDTTIEDTQKKIATFAKARMTQLISNQPDLTGFLNGAGTDTSAFNANVTRGRGQFDLESPQDQTVWFRLKGNWSEQDGADNRYAFGVIGSHLQLREKTLLGAMLQFDHLKSTDDATSISGTGWMVGPYVVTQLPDQPLFLEARALYGQTSNTINPFGTYEDEFETARILAQLKLSGQAQYKAVALLPYVKATYAEETQDTYTDGIGNLIPEQKIYLREAALGLDATYPLQVAKGELELTGGISGMWSSASGSTSVSSLSASASQ